MKAAGRFAARLSTVGFIGLMAALVLAALYTIDPIMERAAAIHRASGYNVSQTLAQSALEVARLRAAIGEFAMNEDDARREAVRLRFDIVASRVDLLEAGETGRFVQGDPEYLALARDFRAAVAAAEPLAESLTGIEQARQLDALLAPVTPGLVRLASVAHVRAGDLWTRDLQELEHLHWAFSFLIFGLFVCSLGLTGVLIRHNVLLRRAHAHVQSLVGGLRRTGEELSRANEQARTAMEEVRLQNLVLTERDRDLQTRNARFDAALNNMSQGLCMADAAQGLIVCNNRFLELFGLSPGVARPGVPISDMFRAIAAGGAYDVEMLDTLSLEQEALAASRRRGAFFVECRRGRAVAVSHQPMPDGGWVATYEDITERRRAEARIRFLAHHDALTSLPNRVHFRDRLDEALRGLHGRSDGLALFCLDLDRFKYVNDTLGHPAGDALLELVSRRLLGSIREADVVGRLGGDEFAVLHASPLAAMRVDAMAQRIIEILSAPYDLEGRRVVVGVSIGIAIAVSGDTNADVLLKNADMALYRAKAEGRGTHRVFEAEMDAEVQARLEIESELRDALVRRQFELFYQPIFDLRNGEVSGYEALMRWRHPERGLIPPSQFIPIAEELGLIVPLGEWAVRQACSDAILWPAPARVSVNLSPVHFRAGDVTGAIADALRRSGLDPARLELEVTESVLLEESDKVLATLHALRSVGTSVALDDFGTGYSSLSYLRSFPFDRIKIDQSFVRELDNRPDCFAIVSSVSELAARLGMTTTAEGIETVSQLSRVREAGCTEAQGYYLGAPRPLGEALRLLDDRAAARGDGALRVMRSGVA